MTQEKKEELTKEREVILKAGLESSSYFHIDDTGLKHEVQEIKSAHRLPSRPAQKQKVPHACVGIAFYDLLDSCFYIRVYQQKMESIHEQKAKGINQNRFDTFLFSHLLFTTCTPTIIGYAPYSRRPTP